MIASVAGTVAALSPDAAVVEVGGVGLLVQCTPATLAGLRVGQQTRLVTTLVVRETELTLYGFADADERDVFETLQSASGVGPRLAQAVLGVHSPDSVRRAVAAEDLAALTKVPGIGRKGAQRIVLDLRDRLGPPVPAPAAGDGGVGVGGAGGDGAAPAAGTGVTAGEQVRLALLGLGYTAREADDALAAALADSLSDPLATTGADALATVPAGNGHGDAGPGSRAGRDGPGDPRANGAGTGRAGSGRAETPDPVGVLLRRALAALRPR
ncbi:MULTISPECIES: Holliday junction branch migration protein RuvA [Protofrankia]|uniref:Holliday junction branch migration complex subunit RuvA n=1 Tax=Protofrankia coriariae TaxID=1562887 RepID=A0ABR5F446_9ACTN|nr:MULTISPECIES: Holliday junction branch migration protein RuvA [Protofrankia]KLL11458.1 ATP-dependent DNA helicase RuvA [Protofrankia coriariae]ONH34972.1 Holliday junction DNA helicase RuvA [Protofrankia sp. BMG5.30]